MAQTKVENKCLKCQFPFKVGEDAVFVGGVRLVDFPIRNLWWDGSPVRKLPEGKLRIRHLVSCKPRGAFHRVCWNDLMLSIPRLMTKIEELHET